MTTEQTNSESTDDNRSGQMVTWRIRVKQAIGVKGGASNEATVEATGQVDPDELRIQTVAQLDKCIAMLEGVDENMEVEVSWKNRLPDG
jgi:hypothetical protein